MKIYVRAYLAENFGDDLFMKILTSRYPNHKFYAISNGFKTYKNKYKNLKVISNKYIFRVLRKLRIEKLIANKCDITLTIGGSMFIEENSNDKNREFIIGKNPSYILGTNFGPCKTNEYFNNVKEAFKSADDVCFREKYSFELFKDLLQVRCATDIAFLTDTSNIDMNNSKKAIISVIDCERKSDICNKEKYEDKIIEMIHYLEQNNYQIILMSFCKSENDEKAIQSILNKCDSKILEKIDTFFYSGNVEEALSVLADSEIIIGSRFHANIIGLIFNKKIIPIAYSKKTINILEDMKFQGPIININDIEKFNVNQIKDIKNNCIEDIETLKRSAETQFEKLDKVLM